MVATTDTSSALRIPSTFLRTNFELNLAAFSFLRQLYWLALRGTHSSHLFCCELLLLSELRLEADLPTWDNCAESNSEWRSGVCEESTSISTFVGSKRSNGWITDVALSNRELTNEALRSDLMLLRLSQSLIIYIGLSSVYLNSIVSARLPSFSFPLFSQSLLLFALNAICFLFLFFASYYLWSWDITEWMAAMSGTRHPATDSVCKYH